MATRIITTEAVTCDYHAVIQAAPDVAATFKGIPLALDTGMVELDLCKECADLLHDIFADFLKAGRELITDPSMRPASSVPSPSASAASASTSSPNGTTATKKSTARKTTSKKTTPTVRTRTEYATARGERGALGGKARAVPRMEGETIAQHRERVSKMRAWGRENGFKVADRGQLPEGLNRAYWEAHPNEAH